MRKFKQQATTDLVATYENSESVQNCKQNSGFPH